MSQIQVHTDGGSRGNPGNGACAFVIEENNNLIFENAKYLGRVTNNFAEYSGVLSAINYLVENSRITNQKSQITFYLDSELVVKQLNGIYKIKNLVLLNFVKEIKRLIYKNNLITSFKYVPREKNVRADYLVNKILDEQQNIN